MKTLSSLFTTWAAVLHGHGSREGPVLRNQPAQLFVLRSCSRHGGAPGWAGFAPASLSEGDSRPVSKREPAHSGSLPEKAPASVGEGGMSSGATLTQFWQGRDFQERRQVPPADLWPVTGSCPSRAHVNGNDLRNGISTKQPETGTTTVTPNRTGLFRK